MPLDQTFPNTALADATAMRVAAQEAVAAGPEDLDAAIAVLQTAMAAEAMAMQNQMAAMDAVTQAEAAVELAQAAVNAADQGPASDQLASQATAAARDAFDVLSAIKTAEDGDAATRDEHNVRKADDSISAKHSGTGVTFSAGQSDKTIARLTAADVDKSPAIEGWASATLKGKRVLGGVDGAANNNVTAMVYSNIEAPEYELFAVTYGSLKPLLAVEAVGTVTAARAAEMTDARWEKLVKIPPSNSYVGASGAGSVEGTFDGVAGTFTCTGNDCPASADFHRRRSDGSIIEDPDDADGNAHTPPGVWRFTTTDKTATVKAADSDYLSFGYWLSKDSNHQLPQEFRVMYGGSKAVSSSVTLLDESVTYKGVAGGKYVTKDDIQNTAHAGYFTATAELEADFRAEVTGLAAATHGHGTLKGSISGFKDGESSPLGDLKLSLSGVLRYDDDSDGTTDTIPNGLHVRTALYDQTTGTDTTDGSGATTNTVKATSGGVSHGTVGAWEAQLFGAERHTNLPTGVAGAFDATIGVQAVVVGGFGAEKVAE